MVTLLRRASPDVPFWKTSPPSFSVIPPTMPFPVLVNLPALIVTSLPIASPLSCARPPKVCTETSVFSPFTIIVLFSALPTSVNPLSRAPPPEPSLEVKIRLVT